MTKIINIKDEDFQALLESSIKPLLVDFWATWCGPCKMVAPLLDKLSEERDDIVVVKIEVDENPETAKKYGIRSIPTMLLIHNNEVVATKIGAVNSGQLGAFLDNNL